MTAAVEPAPLWQYHAMRSLALAAWWTAVVLAAVLINAVDTCGAGEVRDWIFGQTGAAWVQAIGSVGAIGVATWIASRQAHQALIQQRESVASQVDALAGLIQHLRMSMRALPAARKSAMDAKGKITLNVHATPWGRRFSVLRDALMRIRPEQQSSEVSVLVVSNLQPLVAGLTVGAGREECFDLSAAGLLHEATCLEMADAHVTMLRLAAARIRRGQPPFSPEPRVFLGEAE